MVFHNQNINIDKNIEKLEDVIKKTNVDINYIHSFPIIRREGEYKTMRIDERRKLIYTMLNF